MNRWILVVVGVLLLAVGTVFIFQGTGALKGSSMTGSSTWLLVGVVMDALGASLCVRGFVSQGGARPPAGRGR